MGFLDLFKRKRKQPDFAAPVISPAPDASPELSFPYTVLPKQSGAQLLQTWKDADRTAGFPVLLRLDDDLLHMISQAHSIDDPLPDLDAFLSEGIFDLMENPECEDIRGKPGDTAAGTTHFLSFQMDEGVKVVLATLPVEACWQVFRYLPFGGWNECPEPEMIAAFCKRIHERFGAVPAVVTFDTLELVVDRRPNTQEALQLAQEMYVFCPDIVCQGVGSVHALADSLTKSDVWYFWWD